MSTPIEPVVKLIDLDSNVEYGGSNVINFGEVKAGDKSGVKRIRLWNNKGGDTVASTMRDVELFILDDNDAKLEPVVKEGWMHMKCLTNETPVVTRLNDTNTLLIKAAGMEDGQIAGLVNDGGDSSEDAQKCFADLEVYMQIIENVLGATHGAKPFSLAVRYFFT